MEFELINIQEIIDDKENLLPERLHFFREYDKFQKKFKNSKLIKNEHGVEHWSMCPWSWNSPLISRPDRCPCSFLEERKKYLNKLIKLYSGTYKKKKSSCLIL